MLRVVEAGHSGAVSVTTRQKLAPEWGRVISSPYEAYLDAHPECEIAEVMFPQACWASFLDAGRMLDEDFFSADSLLRLLVNGTENAYLRLVLSNVENYAQFRKQFAAMFYELDAEEPVFATMARARRELLTQIADETLALECCLVSKRHEPAKQLAYLNGGTEAEKLEILSIVAKEPELLPQAVKVWPQLGDYARYYELRLDDAKLAARLSAYFAAYRRQKLANTVTPEFTQEVDAWARERLPNKFPARGKALESLAREDAKLFWLDSLGCEYLPFLQRQAERHGLKMQVELGACNLPSTTAENRFFYEDWQGPKEASKALDDIKHGKTGIPAGCNMREAPYHLPAELDALENVCAAIARELKTGKYGCIILTSDHGSSRLAVIVENEISWEMGEKGSHNGRVCECGPDDGEMRQFFLQDDACRYNVIPNYARFKGSRAASVETHGGGALEEFIVPVIAFVLRREAVHASLLKPTVFIPCRKQRKIKLRFRASAPLAEPMLLVEGSRHACHATEQDGIYAAEITAPGKPGKYLAQILDGDASLAEEQFEIQKRGMQAQGDDFFG